jgi:hypothetical protein
MDPIGSYRPWHTGRTSEGEGTTTDSTSPFSRCIHLSFKEVFSAFDDHVLRVILQLIRIKLLVGEVVGDVGVK